MPGLRTFCRSVPSLFFSSPFTSQCGSSRASHLFNISCRFIFFSRTFAILLPCKLEFSASQLKFILFYAPQHAGL